MSTADNVPKMNILSIVSTILSDTAGTEVRLGGAGVSMKVPEWATYLRGIWVNCQGITCTDNDHVIADGRLDTNDGLPIKPFIFLFPPVGCWGATANTSNATQSEFYPVNAPVMPGSNIITYATVRWSVATVYPYAWIDFVFSNDHIQNPRKLDDMPDTQRYRVIGTWTDTVAAGRAVGTAYNFNGGKMITELCGILSIDTQTPANAGVGFASFESNDVPIFPATMHFDAYGSVLGNNGAHLQPEGVTRRPVMAPCEPVVHIQDYETAGAGLTHVTGQWVTGLEFIR